MLRKRLSHAIEWGASGTGTNIGCLHHLDAARAVLFVAGGLPRRDDRHDDAFAGVSRFRADPADGDRAFVHPCVPPVGALHAAGYFAGMASQRRGRHDWLEDRLRRVALPCWPVSHARPRPYRLKVALSPAWENGYRGVPVAFDTCGS
jgi:hypothetical protein